MKEQFKLNITGSALPQLSEKNLHRFSLLVPSINEQMKIVEFLNKECKLIDETIYKYEKMIPLFYNYKNSLIYEVVTGKKEV
jgi:type I restriction enzyme S subunit